MEAKTIVVSAKTHRELEELKTITGASSFDALLSSITNEKLETKNLFGKGRGIRAVFMRDREDRV